GADPAAHQWAGTQSPDRRPRGPAAPSAARPPLDGKHRGGVLSSGPGTPATRTGARPLEARARCGGPRETIRSTGGLPVGPADLPGVRDESLRSAFSWPTLLVSSGGVTA